jgi:hypothetical protein
MKKFLRFLFLAVLTSSWMTVSAVEYHFQVGFDGTDPSGWVFENTYNQSSSSNDSLPGTKAVKMKADYATVTTSSVVGAGVLTYWTRPAVSITDGVLTVFISTDDGSTWTGIDTVKSSDYAVQEYVKKTVDINDYGTVTIKFEAVGGTGTVEVFMLDDISLTKLAPAPDDVKLSDLTMNGIALPGFSAGVTDYAITIDFTTNIPVFAGTPNNPLAIVTVTNLTDLQGDEAARTATLEVLSEDKADTGTYSIVVSVSNYHIQTGFGDVSVDSMGSAWPGWVTDASFITSTIPAPPGNHGAINGTSAFKFMNKVDGDAPFLQSPKYPYFDTLDFWLFVEAPRTGAPCQLKVEAVTNGVTTELATIAESDMATDAWTKFSYTVNEADSTSIVFTATIEGDWDGDMSTATRIWLDDLVISADPSIGSGGTSIKANSLNLNLEYYPNPVSDVLNIDMNGTSVKLISLFNITGQQVYYSINPEQNTTINMNDFCAGMYILKIENESGVISKKIIKK